MLPVSYRVVKGFATFFGVLGILACIAGLIAGIIVNGGDSKAKSPVAATTTSSVVATSSEGAGAVAPATP